MSTDEKPRVALAVVLALTALIGFDIMGIMVRILGTSGYSTFELSAYRNIFGVIPSLLVMAWMGELSLKASAYRIKRWQLALFRGVAVAIAQLCFYAALTQLELATVATLGQTNALFVVLISIVLMGERVGIWRIIAVLIGFAGVVWVLRPGSDSFTLSALLPISAAFWYGFAIVSVRFFDNSISNSLIYLYSTVAGVIASVLMVVLTSGFSEIGSSRDILLIAIMSLSGGTAVLLLMMAYRMAAPSVLAPFSYLGILSAFTFGYFIFDEAPVDTLFPGVILIVGAGAVIIWRESRSKRKDLG